MPKKHKQVHTADPTQDAPVEQDPPLTDPVIPEAIAKRLLSERDIAALSSEGNRTLATSVRSAMSLTALAAEHHRLAPQDPPGRQEERRQRVSTILDQVYTLLKSQSDFFKVLAHEGYAVANAFVANEHPLFEPDDEAANTRLAEARKAAAQAAREKERKRTRS